MSQINALIAQGGGDGSDFLKSLYMGQQMAAMQREGEIKDYALKQAQRQDQTAQGQLNALAKLADFYDANGQKEKAATIRAGGKEVFAKMVDQQLDPKAGYMAAGDVLYDLRGGAPKPVGGNIPMINGQPAVGMGGSGFGGGRGPVPMPGGGSFTGALARSESGGDPNAANPNSTAVGPHQFLESTWLEQLPKHAPGVIASVVGPNADLKDPATRATLLDLRRDPDVSDAVARGYSQENAKALNDAGIQPTPGNLMLAHFLGPGGAKRFLQADPNAPGTSAASPEAVMANRNVFFDKATGRPRTVGELRQMAEKTMAGVSGPDGGQQAQGPAQPAQGSPSGVTPLTDALGRPYVKDAPSGMMWGQDAQGRMVTMPIPGAEDRTQTLSPAEVKTLGLPDGSVVQKDAKGKLSVVNSGNGGPIGGSGLDSAMYNIVLTGDPASPEYAAAYAHLTQPKPHQTQNPDGTMTTVMVSPQLPPNIRRPTWMQGQGDAPGGQQAMQTGGVTVTPVPGVTKDPKFSKEETDAYGFSKRLQDAEAVFSDLGTKGYTTPSTWDTLKSNVPLFGNKWVSADFQKYDQAKRNFINAVLRRESGAAISSSEFDNAEKQYFPAPGDSRDVIAQKAANRRSVIESMQAAGQGPLKFFGGQQPAGQGAKPGAQSPTPEAGALPPLPPGFQIVGG